MGDFKRRGTVNFETVSSSLKSIGLERKKSLQSSENSKKKSSKESARLFTEKRLEDISY